MAAVAKNFFVGKARSRFSAGLRLYGGGHCVNLLLQISIRLARNKERSRFLAPQNRPERKKRASLGMTNPGANASGDGRNNADGVAVLRGRVLFREITDIFIVHINVYEAAQLAFIGEQMLAQVCEFRGQVAERFPDGPGTELR